MIFSGIYICTFFFYNWFNFFFFALGLTLVYSFFFSFIFFSLLLDLVFFSLYFFFLFFLLSFFQMRLRSKKVAPPTVTPRRTRAAAAANSVIAELEHDSGSDSDNDQVSRDVLTLPPLKRSRAPSHGGRFANQRRLLFPLARRTPLVIGRAGRMTR